MNVTIKNLSDLKPPEKNVRLHGNRQIKEYIRSIEMFGQIRPLVIDENNIVLCGNGLLQALQQMGRQTAECYIINNLSDKQKKKLMLTDNKIYELGTNDSNVFDEILRELEGDLDLPGYDEEFLKVLTANAKEADNIINSYGTYSDNYISSLKKHTENAQPFTNQNKDYPSATITSSASNTDRQNEFVQNNQKFIVCPKCGEKIWL